MDPGQRGRDRPLPKLRFEDRCRLRREGCDQSPSQELLRAIQQFNAGDYWDCHETLEELWAHEPQDLRYLYQGILLIGVGLLHLHRHNHHGATVKLEGGCHLLLPFEPRCLGVEVASLRQEVQPLLELLRQGPHRLQDALLQPMPVCAVRGREEVEGGP